MRPRHYRSDVRRAAPGAADPKARVHLDKPTGCVPHRHANADRVNTSGNTQEANTIPIPKDDADTAFDAATCIGCGACVASCKNSSAMLFVSAKVSQFSLLPQGKVEAKERVINMVNKMDEEGFGNCTNTGACEVECPKGISLDNISRMNREFITANVKK